MRFNRILQWDAVLKKRIWERQVHCKSLASANNNLNKIGASVFNVTLELNVAPVAPAYSISETSDM